MISSVSEKTLFDFTSKPQGYKEARGTEGSDESDGGRDLNA